jgi:hypothetical protein
LRLHFQFANDLQLFADIGTTREYGVHIYGDRTDQISFLQVSQVLDVRTAEASLSHDGSGPTPGLQFPAGGWDLRPHLDRVVTVDLTVLRDWSRLFDEPATPDVEARLLRPVTRQDLHALSRLSNTESRLADFPHHWARGHEEDRAKREGVLRWDTSVPADVSDVILQGPHFTVATPNAKEPNEHCSSKNDWSAVDLELLQERRIPRTNYQRDCAKEAYDSYSSHWDGRPTSSFWRVAHRKMTEPGLERSLHLSLLPPGPAVVGTCYEGTLPDSHDLVRLAGLCSALTHDYLVKVSGRSDIHPDLSGRFPLPRQNALDAPLLLRALRLNCLTADYAPLWEELFDPSWTDDDWTADPESPWGQVLSRVPLGDVLPEWSKATPLRRDAERRMALVELDAIAAIMLGLTAEQLCAMYRTQFAVLRKYEYAMAFDAEGRKVCQHHQSAGYRQAQLQQQAKDGQVDKRWKSVWQMVLEEEEHPGSVDWEGHFTPPFVRPDREAEMTRAFEVFNERLSQQ